MKEVHTRGGHYRAIQTPGGVDREAAPHGEEQHEALAAGTRPFDLKDAPLGPGASWRLDGSRLSNALGPVSTVVKLGDVQFPEKSDGQGRAFRRRVQASCM